VKSKDDKYLISEEVGSGHSYLDGKASIYDSISGVSIIDPYYVRTKLDNAIEFGIRDPLYGVSSAVRLGSEISGFLNSSALGLNTEPITLVNLNNTISALGELDRPYNYLGTVQSCEPYLNSMTILASASSLASTIKGLAGLGSIDAVSVTSKTSDLGINISGISPYSPISSFTTSMLTNALAPTMLASTGAVLGLDSAYADLSKVGFAAGMLDNLSVSQVPSYITSLHEGVASLTTAAKTAWDSFSVRPEILSTTSLYMVRSPSIEVYTATQAAAVISLPIKDFPPIDKHIEEIIDEAVDEFEPRLLKLEPALAEMYRGAVVTMERGGPDWQRQTMVSFRELTTHAMHKLAPDERVKLWAKPEHFDNGRLTRKARLEYIFESVGEGEFTNFFNADLKATIELFNLLNNGTHRLKSSATPEQLRYLRGRVVNLLSAMLEAKGH
jgi:hypothetical protein